MTAIRIPIVPVGPGTQPAEADGAELDLIAMPEAMATYSMPELPEPGEAAQYPSAMKVLREVLDRLSGTSSATTTGRPPTQVIDLAELDADNLDLINQTLGEGEVSIIGPGLAIQESVLAGVWRVHRTHADGSDRDVIEIGAIPAAVVAAGKHDGQVALAFDPSNLPPGLQNGPSLIAELNQAIAADAEQPYVINLSLLPHTPEDLLWLGERLGPGTVTILSRGYGNCRIVSTGTQRVWWVQYFNSQDQLILNTLEVTSVPEVACAAAEDLEDSRERLAEILEVIA